MMVFCGSPTGVSGYSCRGLAVNQKHRHLMPLMDISTPIPEAPPGKRRLFVGSITGASDAEARSRDTTTTTSSSSSSSVDGSLFGISNPPIRIIQNQPVGDIRSQAPPQNPTVSQGNDGALDGAMP